MLVQGKEKRHKEMQGGENISGDALREKRFSENKINANYESKNAKEAKTNHRSSISRTRRSP